MSRRMVIAAMGEPKTKEREHASSTDTDSPIYEEWIYGDPPKPTQFVRFKNGRVARLEIAAIGKPIEVHDKNEMGGDVEPTLQARTIVNGDVQPSEDGESRAATSAPTLRRPGEVLDTPGAVPGMGKVKIPTDQQPSAQQPSTQPQQQQTPAASPQSQPSPMPDSSPAPKLASEPSRM
jgi:hypothetical protein